MHTRFCSAGVALAPMSGLGSVIDSGVVRAVHWLQWSRQNRCEQDAQTLGVWISLPNLLLQRIQPFVGCGDEPNTAPRLCRRLRAGSLTILELKGSVTLLFDRLRTAICCPLPKKNNSEEESTAVSAAKSESVFAALVSLSPMSSIS